MVARVALLAAALGLSACGQIAVFSVISPSTGITVIVFYGTVVDAGAHAPLPRASVCGAGKCATTNANGEYRFDAGSLSEGQAPCVTVAATGFDARNLCGSANSQGLARIDASLQRTAAAVSTR